MDSFGESCIVAVLGNDISFTSAERGLVSISPLRPRRSAKIYLTEEHDGTLLVSMKST